MDKKLSQIRTDFTKNGLNLEDLLKNPIEQLEHWLDEAVAAESPEPTAMTLTTIDTNLKPHSRIVLLKGVEDGLTFFTNYNSDKGVQIAEHPNVSVLFFWPLLERQIQVNGKIEKVSKAESDLYFASRPRESQLGAWSSPQSQPIESYEVIQNNYLKYSSEFDGREVPRPDHWGGYRIIPESYEFWQGRPGRMHQRYRYIQKSNNWKIITLAP